MEGGRCIALENVGAVVVGETEFPAAPLLVKLCIRQCIGYWAAVSP